MICRNPIFQTGLIKQQLCPRLLTHHRRCSSLKCSVAQKGIVAANKIGYQNQLFQQTNMFSEPSFGPVSSRPKTFLLEVTVDCKYFVHLPKGSSRELLLREQAMARN